MLGTRSGQSNVVAMSWRGATLLCLCTLEEEGDLGVGGVGEHVEEAALDGTQGGHGRQVLGERHRVARGLDDAWCVALFQVGG